MPRAIVLGLSGPDVTPHEARLFARLDPWGFILFARNIDYGKGGGERLSRLVADLRAAVGRNAPVFIDQEGGRVQRLTPPLAQRWPAPAEAQARAGGAGGIRARHRAMAAELSRYGIDINCAPVIDLAGPWTPAFLRPRIWADRPETVVTFARAAAEGLMEAGVVPVIKHLPGHGAADADSHCTLPVCRKPLEALAGEDFAVVRALADLPVGMTAHVVYPALDPERPATLSPFVIRYLRQALGFEGLLISDDLAMGALDGPPEARVGGALAAGCDLALWCPGDPASNEAAASAAPRLSAEAEARANRALRIRQAAL